MDLDPALCARARVARDARFDGRFFVAVRTTGIYCRPICPARTPRERNVAYYGSAAAAEEAGFRPCRRCRPETAPGSPAWRGTGGLVERALRLIEGGALDAADVPALAERLGLGERQLRRLFAEHVGASPGAVARTRRAHFARRLLDETDLPIARVASAAGFRSLRQFNEAIRSRFGAAPSALRGARPGGPASGARLRLPFRPPYDLGAVLAHLAPRAIPHVEEVAGDVWRRRIATPGGPALVEVTGEPGGSALLLRTRGETPHDWIGLAERARRLFDLGADPARLAEDLGGDPQLAPHIAARPGLRLPGAWDAFESAVRIVLGQQVSVAGATTLCGRLVERFGRAVSDEPPTHLFPTAEALAGADLAGIGLPGARAEALRGLAAAVASGALPLDGALAPDEARDALLALPGIGPWTAETIALRALGDPDAFPAGDLGLRRALGAPGAPAPEAELRRRAEAWRPWRGYAAQWLWSAPSLPRGATA